MGVTYNEFNSPLVVSSEVGIWKAGFRCPDVEITPSTGGDSRWLYTEAVYGKYLVLAVGNSQLADVGFHDHTYRFDIVSESTSAEGTKHHSNSKSFTADWVGMDDSFVVLVRPDMYVAYAGEVEGAQAHLRELFGQ